VSSRAQCTPRQRARQGRARQHGRAPQGPPQAHVSVLSGTGGCAGRGGAAGPGGGDGRRRPAGGRAGRAEDAGGAERGRPHRGRAGPGRPRGGTRAGARLSGSVRRIALPLVLAAHAPTGVCAVAGCTCIQPHCLFTARCVSRGHVATSPPACRPAKELTGCTSATCAVLVCNAEHDGWSATFPPARRHRARHWLSPARRRAPAAGTAAGPRRRPARCCSARRRRRTCSRRWRACARTSWSRRCCCCHTRTPCACSPSCATGCGPGCRRAAGPGSRPCQSDSGLGAAERS